MSLQRAAQVAHDRMILARFNHRYEEALELAKDSAGWLEKCHAGKGDEAASPATGRIQFSAKLLLGSTFQGTARNKPSAHLARRSGTQ